MNYVANYVYIQLSFKILIKYFIAKNGISLRLSRTKKIGSFNTLLSNMLTVMYCSDRLERVMLSNCVNTRQHQNGIRNFSKLHYIYVCQNKQW